MRAWLSRAGASRIAWLFALSLAMSLLLGPAFWQRGNLESILAAIAVEGVMCVGMTIVMVAGGFDLSIGSVMALAGVIAVGAESYGLPVAIALALLAAAAAGLVNGLLVARLGINPFIATLATMIIVRALVLTLTGSEPISGTSGSLMEAVRRTVVGLPVTGLLLLGLAIAGHDLLTRTRTGREIHALGSDEAASHAAGVDTRRLKVLCYVLCSLSAGIAGVVLAGTLNTGSPTIGEQAALNVITAVLLGGTSMSGGVGTVWGSLAGLATIGVLENVMRGLDVPAYWQRIVQGGLLLAIISMDRVSQTRFWRNLGRK